MIKTVSHIERSEAPRAQQLTLLSVPDSTATELKSSSAHTRFQLSKATRERGLAHVAEIRRQLAQTQAEREAESKRSLPPRRPHAA